MKSVFLGLLFAGMLAVGQQTPDAEVLRMGPGMQSPKLTHKEEPSYSRTALDARVQGMVLLQIVVNKEGLPQDITVLSPLGFGLDEKAVEAVAAWRFKPGEKDGQPVNVRATVEVSFRLMGVAFDAAAEQRRTRFNSIVTRLSKAADGTPTPQDLTAMKELAKHKMPAAMCALGIWQTKGLGIPQDAAAGLANVQKAAGANYGPALYLVGNAAMNGEGMPKDESKGLSLIRDAAVLGSPQAQFTLGSIYELGRGVEVDKERSKRYFRLCAASGTAECEYRLARLLIGSPSRKESDWLQGIAWMELADGHGFGPAKTALASETDKLTPDQSQWVDRLQKQLERKQ